jgi:hypothetical protein
MLDPILGAVDIVPATAEHHRWMFATFRAQLYAQMTEPRGADPHRLACALMRVARGPGRCLVAIPSGYPHQPLGWAIGLAGALVFAYVRQPLRLHGIGLQLTAALSHDVPVRLAIWTRDAEAIKKHGLSMDHDPNALWSLCAFARDTDRAQRRHERAA